MTPIPSWSRFQSSRGARLVAAHHVLDLGGVAQAPRPPSQRVQRLGPVPLAQLAEAPQQLRPLLLPHGAGAGEYGGGLGGSALHQPAEVPAQAVDVEVQHAVGDLRPAARPRRAQPAQEGPLLGRGRLEDREAVVEEAQDHVHVPPRADGAGELAQHLESPAHPPALPLAGEQRQRDPEAPAGHADLVNRVLLAGHGPGQLPEDAGHPVLEQEGRSIVGRVGGSHDFVTGST